MFTEFIYKDMYQSDRFNCQENVTYVMMEKKILILNINTQCCGSITSYTSHSFLFL